MSDDYTDLSLPPEEPTLHEPAEPAAAPAADPEAAYGSPFPTPTGESTGERPGIPLDDDGMPPVDVLREAMKAVIDPEIGYNVVELGLVYEIEKQPPGQVLVTMTLTTMGCPLTELIHQQVSVILGALPGVDSVDVDFTFTPPWSTEMMSDEVREELRAMGMNV